MRLLLDTHAFLWWRAGSPELDAEAKAAITDADNQIFISAAVGWEITIKRALGRLRFDGDVFDAVRDEGFDMLDITLKHTDAVKALPLLHADPFDRILIAQAKSESMTLMTRDARILGYPGLGTLLG